MMPIDVNELFDAFKGGLSCFLSRGMRAESLHCGFCTVEDLACDFPLIHCLADGVLEVLRNFLAVVPVVRTGCLAVFDQVLSSLHRLIGALLLA